VTRELEYRRQWERLDSFVKPAPIDQSAIRTLLLATLVESFIQYSASKIVGAPALIADFGVVEKQLSNEGRKQKQKILVALVQRLFIHQSLNDDECIPS